MNSSRQRGLAAPFALVTGFGALFALGTVAAGLHGKISPTAVLIVTAAVVAVLAFAAEPIAAIPLGVVGWLCAVGFSHPPYGQLRLTGPFAGRSAIVIAACALAAGGLGLILRRSESRPILEGVGSVTGQQGSGAVPARSKTGRGAGGRSAPEGDSVLAKAAYAVGARRALSGVLVAAIGLPLLTLLLALARNHGHLSLTDDLLIYLVAVVALAVIGGFWPAVLGAAAAQRLGIDRIRPGMRIWVGGQWFYVTGILRPDTYAPQIDSAVLVGFAAETENLAENGRAKLAAKGCDLLVVNRVGRGLAFGTEDNQATVLAADGSATEVSRGPKDVLADVVWDLVTARMGGPPGHR